MSSPRIPLALMLWLEQLYPPKCIAPGQTVEAAHRYAGRVDLVDELRNHFNTQNPDAPTIEAARDVDPETGVMTYDELYSDLVGPGED